MCLGILKSSIGKKTVVALSGLFLMGFVVAHLLGNLQIFLGPEWLNGYAEHLEELPLLLWPARIFLLFALALHMSAALSLAVDNRRARPVRYIEEGTVQATTASRTIVLTGPVIFLFIVYHLMHFTWGVAHPQYFHFTDAKGHHDVYSMVVLSFQNAPVSAVYGLAVFMLGMHLRHGSSSFLQTLGWLPPGSEKKARKFGHLFGWLIFLGYASIPAAVLLGWLKPMQGGL